MQLITNHYTLARLQGITCAVLKGDAIIGICAKDQGRGASADGGEKGLKSLAANLRFLYELQLNTAGLMRRLALSCACFSVFICLWLQ